MRFEAVGKGKRCNGETFARVMMDPSIVERRGVKRESKGYFDTATTVKRPMTMESATTVGDGVEQVPYTWLRGS